jgi:NSS family neurotransmitter:Na+ symporter
MSAQATSSTAGGRKTAATRWSSPLLFVLAASGATIGFNNIWQFPSLVTENGGGAFLILYVFVLIVVGVPLFAAELVLGRRARLSPPNGMRWLAGHTRSDPNWAVVGWMGVFAGFLIFSYLSVVAAWALAYLMRTLFGVLSGQTAEGLASLFTALVQDPEKQLFWFTVFVAATAGVLARGVRGGLERLARIAMPLLLALLALLFVYGMTSGAFLEALAMVFRPDFGRLGGQSFLSALGHVFFSLGLGAGVILMYGAYVADDVSIPRVAAAVVALDTAVGVVAAVTVNALLIAGSVEAASGPTLVFEALPLAMDHLPLGRWLGVPFFLLLVLAAWLSATALLEPLVAWLMERYAVSRRRAVLGVAVATWLAGLTMMLSFHHWAFEFRFFEAVKKLGLFDIAQILTSYLLLPLTGLAAAIFAGWRLPLPESRAQLGFHSPCAFDAWLWLMRLAIPALLVVLVFKLPELLA